MVTWIALNTLTKTGALGTNIHAVVRLEMVTWIAYDTHMKMDALGTKKHVVMRLKLVTWIAYNTLMLTDALGTLMCYKVIANVFELMRLNTTVHSHSNTMLKPKQSNKPNCWPRKS